MQMQCELPEPLIQAIQSLLTSKQAAQTTILSKSWRSAFFTRPNLDFDHTDFLRSDGTREIVPFWDYVSNTITTYAQSNMKIHSFRICVQRKRHFDYTSLILRALEIGATHLSIEFPSSDHFDLPKEVLGSENLVALTLKRANIYLHDQDVIRCLNLESLCLENVEIKSGDLFSRILSACPLIQNLSLCHINHDDRGSLRFDVDVATLALSNLRRLSSLVLVCVDFDTLFLRDLSSNFPVLNDLTILRVVGQEKEEILISSRSLQRLEIVLKKSFKWFRNSSTIQKAQALYFGV